MKNLSLSSAQIAQISVYCENLYPEEACGLFVGERKDHQSVVQNVIFAENISDTPCKNFEIDPKVLIDTARSARETGIEILGHFHSHPDQSAKASKTDESMTYDKTLHWLIVSVIKGRVKEMSFYNVNQQDNALILKKNIRFP